MYTNNFQIFSDMVDLTKAQKLDYRIFYSCKPTRIEGKTVLYNIILCSSLYNVAYNKFSNEEEEARIKLFIGKNNCIKLDCEIKISNNKIELI